MIIRTEEDQADQRQQIQQDFLILMSTRQAGTLLHPELCNVFEIQPCLVVFPSSFISSSTYIPGAVLTAANKEDRLNQITSEVRIMQ